MSMHDSKPRGRVTIPTDIDVIPQTKELLARWAPTPSVTATAPTFRRS